jgi:His/Glu/Gln/Arg/opine family amino acid ABC transporter permease subunit
LTQLQLLLEGALFTFAISFSASAIGIPLGLLVALARLRKLPVVTFILELYVTFFRALPIVLLMMLFYFVCPQLALI